MIRSPLQPPELLVLGRLWKDRQQDPPRPLDFLKASMVAPFADILLSQESIARLLLHYRSINAARHRSRSWLYPRNLLDNLGCIVFLFILFFILSSCNVCPGSSDPFYIVPYYIYMGSLLPGQTVVQKNQADNSIFDCVRAKLFLYGFIVRTLDS